MVDVTKPIYGEIWANSGEKLSPGTDKIATGWIQEMMPYQYENFLQNRTDVAISYLLQKGIPEWSADQEYIANKSVVTYSGQLYLATTTSTNVLPTVAASWRRLTLTFGANGAIPVAFGGTGATNAADARTNLGIGSAATVNLPASNGLVVKLADNSLVARTIAGTSGYITVTNGDGLAGSPTINVGTNVAKTDADAAWTTKTSIKIPSGTTAERGVGAPGRIRFNIESGVYEGYDNTGWSPIGSNGTMDVQTFQGDGTTTSFTLSSTPRAENNTQVFFNGIYQQKNSYELVGNNLVFDEAPAADISVEVVTIASVAIGTTTASQTSVVDGGGYYNSTNVEGALQEIGSKTLHSAVVYQTKDEAESVVSTLQSGQIVDALDVQERYTVQGNALVFVERLRSVQLSTEKRPLEQKLSERMSILDAGGKGDGVFDNSEAFSIFSADQDVYIPSGVFFTSSPPLSRYYGEGSIKIGSQIFKVSATPQEISSYEQTEVNGLVIRYSNFKSGVDAGNVLPNNSSNYANTFVGTSAGQNVAESVRSVVVGTSAMRDMLKGYSNTVIGTNAIKWGSWADRNTVVGDNACINLGCSQDVVALVNGIYNGATTLAAQFDARYPAWRAKYWDGDRPAPAVCMTASDFGNKATHNVVLGRNALGFSITATNSVALGYDAATSAIDASNLTAVGDRCMQYSIDVVNSAAYGNSAFGNTAKVNQSVGVGPQVGYNFTVVDSCVVGGYQAMRGSASLPNGATATGNVVLGRIAAANAGDGLVNSVVLGNGALAGDGVNGSGHVTVGHRSYGSLKAGGSGNAGLGQDTARYLVSGSWNTALGTNSLSFMADGTQATQMMYATGVGWGARVSGDYQLQLGSPSVTTYAFGAVQDRSDARDKADVRDTVLGLAFINDLRPVDFKWDMRDDYVQTNEDGTVEVLPKDGSKKRGRYHHGVIAQELRAVMEKHGVDFGGFQDHSVNGGCDVLSVGYTELIAPLIKAVQELSARVQELESR